MGMAAKRVGSFGPSELTFVLDGMARLQVKAPAAFMTALAQRVIISWLSLLGGALLCLLGSHSVHCCLRYQDACT